MRRAPRGGRAALLGAALALAAGAGARAGDEPGEPLRVYADAALTEAFRAINTFDWCGREPRAELYLADSSTLVAQIERGAQADVIATDDGVTMQRLVDAGRVAAPRRFARAEPVSAVEAGSPRAVRAEYWIAPLRDAARPELARAFVDAVLSRRGQAVLARQGFLPAAEEPAPISPRRAPARAR